MTKITYAYDKLHGKTLPKVSVGNERLTSMPQSHLGSNLLVCEAHGSQPFCHIRWRGILTLCCRKCILENCSLTEAIRFPRVQEDVLNPAGHSY